MPRPPGDVSNTLHGAMKDLAYSQDLDVSELYEAAARLIVILDPEAELKPGTDATVERYLELCKERDA